MSTASLVGRQPQQNYKYLPERTRKPQLVKLKTACMHDAMQLRNMAVASLRDCYSMTSPGAFSWMQD